MSRKQIALPWSPAGRSSLRGFSVALLGPDGSGKSTLAEGLRQTLSITVRVVYLGLYRTSRWRQQLGRVPGAMFLVRLTLVRAGVWKGRRSLRRGELVVFDRYTIDTWLPLPNPSSRARVSRALLSRAAPPPDLVLLLDAPGSVMFQRKGEHSVEELERNRAEYLGLLDRMPNMVVLDATLPADEVLRQARTHVEQQLAKLGVQPIPRSVPQSRQPAVP